MKPLAITSTTILILLSLQLCQASPISPPQPPQYSQTLASSITTSLDRVLKILFTAPTPITQTRSFENSTSTHQNGTKTYTIRPGDTFTSIAAELGTSVSTLESANPMLNPVDLQIGDIVLVPGSVEGSGNSTASRNGTEAVVKEISERRLIKLWWWLDWSLPRC